MTDTEKVTTEQVESTETVAETPVEEVKQEEKVETPETPVETTEEQPEEKVEETTETEEQPKEDEKPEEKVETEPEEVEDKPDEDSTEVDTLKASLKKEQGKVDSLKTQVKALEAVVSGLVDAKLKDIPKEFHGLIPEGDSVGKLAWINKAEESGIFKKTATPEVEIGKPLEVGNDKPKAKDNSTAQQKLSNYFSNFYHKK